MLLSKSLLITGAASGIGRAIALRAAADGANLALLDRDHDGLTATASEALAAGAGAALALTTDIRDGDSVAGAVARATAGVGTLDGLACAAGILRPGRLAEISEQDWREHLDVNSGGVLHCLQAAVPVLRDGGAVVVIGSNAARVPRVGIAAYAASKAATAALVRCAGLELSERAIRCNVIEPGSTQTPMLDALWLSDPEGSATAAIAGDPDGYRVGIPLGRVAEPDDVAAMACFLLSDDARHVTLQQIYVDGGASL